MKFVLIRHGRTQGNLEHRYIGCRTDEPLLPEERERLCAIDYPRVDGVFASPMRRCVETARTIYPGKEIALVPGLRECDFGEFENLNYEELKDRPEYQAWIDSGGELPFPGGESKADFSARCISAFESAIRNLPDGTYAFVVHGGTIMAVMERFARPEGNYYDFQVKNGKGFVLNGDGNYEALV